MICNRFMHRLGFFCVMYRVNRSASAVARGSIKEGSGMKDEGMNGSDLTMLLLLLLLTLHSGESSEPADDVLMVLLMLLLLKDGSS